MDAAAFDLIHQVLVKPIEFTETQDLEKHSQKLGATLEIVQKLLYEAETQSIPNEAIKKRLRKLEAEIFEADNVFDEFRYHLLSKKISIPTRDKVLKSSNPYGSQQRPAHRITQIIEECESIQDEARRLGFVSEPADEPDLPETGSFSADPVSVGRDDDDVLKLADLLTNTTPDPEEGVFSILVIQGMGGMGKTMFTRKLFNHPNIQMRFCESRIWVHVSQTFDPLVILKKILKYFTSDQVESRQHILKRLQQVLKCKTYLLVLDDVRNEDVLIWEDFINLLAESTSTKGNGIIITTRNQEVASIVGPRHTHHLIGLSAQDCWSIIKAKAFDNGDDPSAFEATGHDIAIKCHGLPLAAEIVGGLLYKASQEKWKSVQQNWLSEDEGQTIPKILRLSLHNLSYSLKKCFAYCLIFPRGRKIVKQELIELWMGEGFLQPDQINDMEYVGNKFFDVLVHKSLLQIAER